MDKAAKAEARIKAICDKLGITDGGRKWVDVALDPFKDILTKPTGFPDRNMAPSVVQVVHDEVVIKAPAGAPANWDCNIFLDQLWATQQMVSSVSTFPRVYEQVGQGATPYNRGGLVVRSAAEGTDLDITTTQNASCLPYVTDVFSNNTAARVIAIGFEVHNTTAEIQKQGGVICYKVSEEPYESTATAVDTATAACTSTTLPALELTEPPYSPRTAIDLPGSVQWDAARGVYVVPCFISEENPAVDLRPMVATATDAKLGTKYGPLVFNSGSLRRFTNNPNSDIKTSLSGAYFVGLSQATTLTVNLTYYVEQFPSFNSALHRISSPSCPEDMAALELYTKVARKMPTGVEVNDNFLGAFVSGISTLMRTVSPYIPSIIRGVGTVLNGMNGHLNMGNSDERVQTIREDRREERREQRIENAINNNTNREIVIYQPPKNEVKGNEVIIRTNNAPTGRTNNPTNFNNNGYSGNNNQRRNGGVPIYNKRNKDYNRLDKYYKAGNSGNRTIIPGKL